VKAFEVDVANRRAPPRQRRRNRRHSPSEPDVGPDCVFCDFNLPVEWKDEKPVHNVRGRIIECTGNLIPLTSKLGRCHAGASSATSVWSRSGKAADLSTWRTAKRSSVGTRRVKRSG
jgi:hypothetical protein